MVGCFKSRFPCPFFSEISHVNFISLTAYIMISYVPPSFNSREKNRQTSCKWKWRGRLRPVWLICSIKWVRFQNQLVLNHLKCNKSTIVKIKSRSHLQAFNLRLPKVCICYTPAKKVWGYNGNPYLASVRLPVCSSV